MLKSKYYRGIYDIDMFVSKEGSSNVWNGITENAKVLCEGMTVAVGNSVLSFGTINGLYLSI